MRRKCVACILHTPIIAFVDVVLVHVGLLFSLLLTRSRFASFDDGMRAYVHQAPLLTIVALTIFYVSDLYSDWVRKSKTELTYSVACSATIFGLAVTTIGYLYRQLAFPRSAIVISPVLVFVLVFIFRISVRTLRNQIAGPARALLICTDVNSGQEIASQINATEQGWVKVEAYLPASELIRLQQVSPAFETIIIGGSVERKAEIIDFCANHKQQVMVVPDFFELSMVGARPMQIDDILMFNINPPHLSTGQRLLKRALDIVGSAVLLVLTSPVLLIIPIAIRLSSKGPALFQQERIGRGGEEYTLFKFRTMMVDAEEQTGPILATKNDPRITRLGRFLRDTRLDELPQLFNVLRGNMSLVGPRPERAHFVREFCMTVPSYQYRFLVKPGITGLAQVYGKYSTTPARKVRFDLMYIYDYSLVQDLKILLKTLLVVLKREQAAGVSISKVGKLPESLLQLELARQESMVND